METYVSSMSQAIIAFSTVVGTILLIIYYTKQISSVNIETIVLLVSLFILGLVLVYVRLSMKLKWKK